MHDAVKFWAPSGYGLVAPLYDLDGKLASIQARRVRAGEPKTRFPKGGRAKGVVFANNAGLAVLRGETPTSKIVIFGEGLTDHLAFSFATSLPTICAPGVGSAPSCISSWVRHRNIVIALDCDPAGEKATIESARLAYEKGAGRVKRVRWPDQCVDACDALWSLGSVAMANYLDLITEAAHARA